MILIFTNMLPNVICDYFATIWLHAELNYFKVCLPNPPYRHKSLDNRDRLQSHSVAKIVFLPSGHSQLSLLRATFTHMKMAVIC